MSQETWLLSAIALSAPANAGTTSYTSEVRQEITVDMQQNCAAAEKTFTEFTAVQKNLKNTSSSREETSSALKEQSNAAEKIISEIVPKTEVTFFNTNNGHNRGAYHPYDNVIEIRLSKTTQTKLEQNDVTLRNLSTIAHERHHQLYNHMTIQTSDEKTVLANQAPMSLEQRYKLEQADEIGSNITECLLYEEVYREAVLDMEKIKKNLLQTLKNDEKLKEEYAPVIKMIECCGEKEVPAITYKDNMIFVGDKQIEVKSPELLNQFEDLQTHISRRNDADNNLQTYGILVCIGNEPYKGAPQILEDKSYSYLVLDPFNTNPDDFKKGRQLLGARCTSKWMDEWADEYTEQCTTNTSLYFQEHNFQEIKANDENFNKALSSALTIGGWDFSNEVKNQLSCQNTKFIEADKMIANGENELAVINTDPELFKKKLGLLLESASLVDIATEYAKDVTVGKKKFKSQPVVWTNELKEELNEILPDVQNQINTCPKKQQEQADKLFKSLDLDKLEVGQKLSDKQIINLDKLSTILEEHAQGVDPFCWMNPTVQAASIPEKVKKEWNDISEKKGYGNCLNSTSCAEIKRYVVEAYSGQELGMSAEQFSTSQDTPNTYKGAKQSTITMTDFSQPFLLDRYNKYVEIAAVKERVGDKLDKTQTTQTTPTAQQTTAKNSVNMAQLAAQRQGGR